MPGLRIGRQNWAGEPAHGGFDHWWEENETVESNPVSAWACTGRCNSQLVGGWLCGHDPALCRGSCVFIVWRGHDRPPATADNDSVKPEVVLTIVAINPQAKAVTLTEQYVRQIHSNRRIDVRAETGYLKASPIKEGQAVKEGKVLFEVVPVLYKFRLDAGVGRKRSARLELNNTKKLAEKQGVAQIEVKLFEAKLAKAQAKADLAEAELNFTKVRAPFDGIVDLLNEQGSLVKEGEVLATLSDNSLVRVYFNVPETRYLAHMTDPIERTEDLQIELILANGKKFGQIGKLGAIKADFNNATGTIPFCATFRTRTACCVTARAVPC